MTAANKQLLTFTDSCLQLLTSANSLQQFLVVIYIIKELVQPKMSLNREFLIWKERGRGEIGRGRRGEIGRGRR